ncbi:hypothetical protein LNY53_29625 [Klebsiella pneumoniae]|nr:hypothetical protein [Klebsiella pneumoniae]
MDTGRQHERLHEDAETPGGGDADTLEENMAQPCQCWRYLTNGFCERVYHSAVQAPAR